MRSKIFKKVLFSFVIIDLLLLIRVTYFKFFETSFPTSIKVDIKDTKMVISFKTIKEQLNNKVFCTIKEDDEIPKTNDKSWVLSKNNQCIFNLTKNKYKAYIMSSNNEIKYIEGSDKLGTITNLNADKTKVYLALNGTYTPTLTYDYVGNINNKIVWKSNDDNIAEVSEDGTIKGLSKGETKVIATLMDKNVSIDVIVTNLIVTKPKEFSNKKSYLPCGKYSEEENDLLDEILEDRINTVGYKTRAGAVEAARFLTLEFPYKIRYFSENGREATNGVQGEGRYYNKGLYLHSSRFVNIKKTAHGPETWGCSLYSNPSHGTRANGLDCSGFISWVLLNGGFDVGDIGAGLASHLDLTDYGQRIDFNYSVVKSGKVKVGDLLSSGGVNGGHIAMIAGEDDNYYYVAESLWTPPNVSVGIYKYSKDTIFKRYYYVMLMDSYYKEDGKLTKLWY